MRSRLLALSPALVLALGLSAQADVVVEGRFFELHCSGVDERVATQALATVEPVWPEVCAFFGEPTSPPAELLRVHLYREVDDYRRADRRLTGGRFGPNQAMSHWSSKSAHVAVQPPCSDAVIAAQGLPMQTMAMLAWEACHISRYALCPNFRVHPGWFYDGLAAIVAQRVLQGRYASLGPQPFFAQRWVRSRRLAASGDLPGVRQLCTDATQGLEMRDRYAARVAFFEFAERRDPQALRRVAVKVRNTSAGTGYAGAVADAAREELGALERAFHAFASVARPAWDEQVRSLWCLGGDWQQQAFAEASAIAIRGEPVRGAQFDARGEVKIQPCGARQLQLLFGWTSGGGFAMAFEADAGFALLAVASDGSVRRVLREGRCEALRAGAFCSFELSVVGRALSLRLAGDSWQLELPQPLPREVRWGVAAASGGPGEEFGSAGVWRGLRVEAR